MQLDHENVVAYELRKHGAANGGPFKTVLGLGCCWVVKAFKQVFNLVYIPMKVRFFVKGIWHRLDSPTS